jgi:hypothetical protein
MQIRRNRQRALFILEFVETDENGFCGREPVKF